MKIVYIVIISDCNNDTSDYILGIYTTEARAIKAAMEACREGGFFSWYLNKTELNSGLCKRIHADTESVLEKQGFIKKLRKFLTF